MKKIDTFDDFQKEVLKRISGKSWPIEAIGSFFAGILSPFYMFHEADYADGSSMGLTHSIYLDCLEKEYKQQFEMNKQNPIYVDNLINKAVKRLKSL